MADVATRQNSDRILDLQRAIAVTHKRSQRVYAAALLVSVAVAALGILAKLVPSTASAVSLTGALWTGAYAIVLSPWAPTPALIAALEDSLRLHRHQPGTLNKLDRYLHQRTHGMIGSLLWLIRSAAINAVLDGTEAITKKSLDVVEADITSQSPRPPAA